MTKVSVIIPPHNRPKMLAEAIKSVRQQTFTDYEIIVVSNGEDIIFQSESCAVAAEQDVGYYI